MHLRHAGQAAAPHRRGGAGRDIRHNRGKLPAAGHVHIRPHRRRLRDRQQENDNHRLITL